MAFDWEKGDPGDHGLDPDGLARMEEDLVRRGTKALLVARHDRVVWEYSPRATDRM